LLELPVMLMVAMSGLVAYVVAHASELECNGLSSRIEATKTIMTHPIAYHEPSGDLPFQLHRIGSSANFSFQIELGYDSVLEILPSNLGVPNNLTSLNSTEYCLSGGGGLCPKCSSVLYATNNDCGKPTTCVFGASHGTDDHMATVEDRRGLQILVAWSELGGPVSYTQVNLTKVKAATETQP
jgi:hypothetical protein